MSAQLRQCRQGLAKALGKAVNHFPGVKYCSATFSGPVPPEHPEMIHNYCLSLTDHNLLLTQHIADCGQGSRHALEGVISSKPEPDHQDLPVRTESPSMEILDELIVKLVFENVLNQVCNRLSVNVNMWPVRGDSTGSADSGVEEGAADGEEDEEEVRLINMVLDMEQDYKLFVY